MYLKKKYGIRQGIYVTNQSILNGCYTENIIYDGKKNWEMQ